MYGTPTEIYRTLQKSSNSGRELEASVLTKAALALKHCQEHWDDPDRGARLDEAIRLNHWVWSVFQSELANPDHPLPKKLREDILRLSAFIDKRLLEFVASPTAAKLTAVININLSLAAGLRGKP